MITEVVMVVGRVTKTARATMIMATAITADDTAVDANAIGVAVFTTVWEREERKMDV